MEKVAKIINKKIGTKLIVYGIFPLFLILVWIGASLLFNNKISFSILEYPESSFSLTHVPSGMILRGGYISGVFSAKENNLGIILLKFDNYVKPQYNNEDVLVFSIKQKDSDKWFYSGLYRSGAFEHQTYFPFGFSPISGSKNKIYEFRLVSQNGNSSNALTVSKDNPVLITGYRFSKHRLMDNRTVLVNFMVEKIVTSFTNLDFFLSSVSYLLPLLFYTLMLLYLTNKQLIKKYIFRFSLALVILEIILLPSLYYGIILGLVLLWIFMIRIIKLAAEVTFIFALGLIFVWSLLNFLNIKIYTDSLNVWTYSLLAIGAAQLIIEEKFKFHE